MNYKEGETIQWRWGNGEGKGKIKRVITQTVSKVIKGSHITRHGSHENPALLIEQEDGDEVLKLASELE